MRKLAADHPESPDYASALGGSLHNLARLDLAAGRFAEARDELHEAVAWQRKALAANGRSPQYRQFLANHFTILMAACSSLDDAAGVADARRQLAELQDTDPQFQALDKRLIAVAGGAAVQNNSERLALAQRAYDTKRYTLAARLWSEALEADPTLADNRRTQPCYNAACAAALASAGQGNDDPAPDDAAKSKLRNQAREWLEAELELWTRMLAEADPQQRKAIAQTLNHWRTIDTDLAGIRDVDALVKLPGDEREAFTKLWANVAALFKRAEAPPVKEVEP